ncbi:hypothetical protein [Pseudovibrio brasiliensis]|uniref:Uncharacterized protein n=1 Tax=Pseudovibrio brasiliensis TaxID=1898042 RepID=A0ABX8AL83_9HYPH|nr:hypothetical protein [Pseudovibrio brasiliensis]QUS55022.1 hypothetical protein KGB56_16880 [Pseudovibrio brasiliensis]
MPRNVPDSVDSGSSGGAAEVDWAREIYSCLGLQFPDHEERVDFLADKTVQRHIGEFEGKEVRVASTTFEDLKLAQDVIWQTKGLLSYGAGNLVSDVFASDGESYLRSNYAMSHAAQHGGLALSSIQSQAGNCSSHADISYMLLSAQETDRPVARVSSTVRDHAFTMIGDYRDPTQETVVVDAWPTFPSAFRFKDGDLSVLSEKPLVKTWSAPGPKPPVVINLEGVKPIPLKQMQDFFKRMEVPQKPGRKLKDFIVDFSKRSSFLSTRAITVENPAIVYMPATGVDAVNTYEMPKSYAKAKIKGMKAGEKRGFK